MPGERCLAGKMGSCSHQRIIHEHLDSNDDKNWRRAWFYEYFYENPYNFAPYTLAVRTDAAKLIKYPGHDDWTELFDLSTDPYETKNLFADPAHKDLRDQMLAEFDKQEQAVKYQKPAKMDEPKPEEQKRNFGF